MQPSDLTAADRIAVYGYGREGRALVQYVREHAPDARLVVLVDGDPPPDATADADEHGFELVVGTDAVLARLSSEPPDLLLRSPGVSRYGAAVTRVRERGIPVTTSTSLWLGEHEPDNVIAVTGTKGKSTTTTLLAHLLRAAGRQVALAGNIGLPVLEMDRAPSAFDHVVLELSSYQLADLEGRLALGVWLNLHREHLDWHGDEATYEADKGRIVTLSDTLIANASDVRVAVHARHHDHLRWFDGTTDPVLLGTSELPAAELRDALAASPLVGGHHLANLAAALTAVATVGVDPVSVLPAVADVEPLPHRLELVHDDGRRWIDDSIATIPEATVAALGAFPETPITLIAGGYERGQDHAPLVHAIADRGDVTVVTMPDTGPRLAGALGVGAPDTPVVEVADLKAAVTIAAERTPAGGVVLLSPAAPSYGRFRSFEERGDEFARLARDTASERP